MGKRSLFITRLSAPYAVRRDHERGGGRDLRGWVARVPDGAVRLLPGREPIAAVADWWRQRRTWASRAR